MPRHATAVIELTGSTVAAAAPVNIGNLGNPGASIIGIQVSTQTISAMVAPNLMRITLGSIGAPGPILAAFYAVPVTNLHTIVLPSFAPPGIAGGYPITAAQSYIWFESTNTVNVRCYLAVTLWLL